MQFREFQTRSLPCESSNGKERTSSSSLHTATAALPSLIWRGGGVESTKLRVGPIPLYPHPFSLGPSGAWSGEKVGQTPIIRTAARCQRLHPPTDALFPLDPHFSGGIPLTSRNGMEEFRRGILSRGIFPHICANHAAPASGGTTIYLVVVARRWGRNAGTITFAASRPAVHHVLLQ